MSKIIVAVGAVIEDNEGRILLVKHKPERGGYWQGEWICPGGKLELGETLEEAAKAHSKTISSFGSGVAWRAVSLAKISVADSVNVSAHGTN